VAIARSSVSPQYRSKPQCAAAPAEPALLRSTGQNLLLDGGSYPGTF